MSVQNLLNQVEQIQSSLPPSQRLVAAFVLNNYNQIPFLTITKLAHAVGTSNNSVVKFCESLGYSKFTEFKAVFSSYAHDELDMARKISTGQSISQKNNSFLREIQENSESISTTLSDPHNCETIPIVVEKINAAKNIYVFGARSSALFASQLAYQLRYLGLRVQIIPDNSYYLDILSTTGPGDLLIAYSFPRYIKSTLTGLRTAHTNGVDTVVFTDSELSPAVSLADLSLFCSIKTSSYFLCCTGCIALSDLICNAVATSRREAAVKSVRLIERHLYREGYLSK